MGLKNESMSNRSAFVKYLLGTDALPNVQKNWGMQTASLDGRSDVSRATQLGAESEFERKQHVALRAPGHLSQRHSTSKTEALCGKKDILKC